MDMKLAIFLWLCLTTIVHSSIVDYLPSLPKFITSLTESHSEATDVIHGRQVPYEVTDVDEKFIVEANKLTGLVLSELDSCQHRVILHLKTKCNQMNDEQIAKLAVMLLNCQSAIENREVFPCTENMAIGECTKNMNADVWNSYHLMTNRAKAVCVQIRQTQFRGLTELTVNKLLSAAQTQLKTMDVILDNQQTIRDQYERTIAIVRDGNEAIQEQQKDLRQAQLFSQLSIEENIQRLVQEKALIRAGHEQMARLVDDVRNKLDSAGTAIQFQSDEQRENHAALIDDLLKIRNQAEDIWREIEKSSDIMRTQSEEIFNQYAKVLDQLRVVNATVNELVHLFQTSRLVFDEKLTWLSEALGGTGNTLERLYLYINHIGFLLVIMIVCAFVNVSTWTRLIVIVSIPLNLLVSLHCDIDNALTMPLLGLAVLSLIVAHVTLDVLKSMIGRKPVTKQALTNGNPNDKSPVLTKISEQSLSDKSTGSANSKISVQSLSNKSTSSANTNVAIVGTTCVNSWMSNNSYLKDTACYDGTPYKTVREYSSRRDETLEEFDLPNSFNTSTPVLSAAIVTKRRLNSRSRSKTPLEKTCVGVTKAGARCRSVATNSGPYCFRHAWNDSLSLNGSPDGV